MQAQPRQTSSDCMSTLGTSAEKCWGLPRKDHSQPLLEHWDLQAGNPSGNSDTNYSNGSDAFWYSVGPGLVTVHLPTDVVLISFPHHLCPLDPVMGVHMWSTSSCPPSGASGEKPTGQYRRHKRCEFDPWVGKGWTRLKQISMPPYQGQIAPWKDLLRSLLEQSKRYGYDLLVAVRKEKYVCLREIWNFEWEEFGNKLDLAIIEERRGTVEPSSWCLNSFEF